MLLQNKTLLITGIASERSIAYGIAKACAAQGAQLILTYQNEKLKTRVEKAAATFNAIATLELDVSSDDSLNAFYQDLKSVTPSLDGIVHAIAYADRSQLEGNIVDNMTRSGFLQSQDISSYSLAALTKICLPLMRAGGSVITLTYIGSQRAMPSYNAMGLAKASLESMVKYMAYGLGEQDIRVNAISAGAIKTLAASGIKGFKKLHKQQTEITPLKSALTIDHVGGTAAFLLSDLAAAITGDVIYVDNGFHLVGAPTITEEATA